MPRCSYSQASAILFNTEDDDVNRIEQIGPLLNFSTAIAVAAVARRGRSSVAEGR